MTLTVHRLQARLQTQAPIAAVRLQAWQGALAAPDDDAQLEGLVGPEEWLLIHHLRVATRWGAEAGDAEVAAACGLSLRQAVQAALASGDGALVLRYAHKREALADLLYRSSLGQTKRQWAWQRMGLLARDGVAADEALQAGLQRLQQTPEWIWPVLQRLLAAEAETAAFTALLRSLSAAAWKALGLACPRTAIYATAPAMTASSDTATLNASDATTWATQATVQTLLTWAAARRHLAGGHLEVLAVLAAAVVWPGTGSAGPAALARAVQRRRYAQQQLAAATGAAQTMRIAPPAKEAAQTAPTQPQAETELPALPDATRGAATQHAGLLFWLLPLARSGALQDVVGDADALQSLLAAVAHALDVPADDPVSAAFCGGTAPPATPGLAAQAHAAALLADWDNWLAQQAPELALPRLGTVTRREGHLRIEPGWIELHMPLASSNPVLRRLGLDLNPGWLPWLGCAVSFHYDD